MSDPNTDADDGYTSMHEFAFADFEHWCKENAEDDETDITDLAQQYADACDAGEWVVGCRMPTLDTLKNELGFKEAD